MEPLRWLVRFRPRSTIRAALAPILLAAVGALMGVYSGAHLGRTASAMASAPSLEDASVRLSQTGDAPWVMGPGTSGNTRAAQPMVVAATGSQAADIVFGDKFGQGVPKAVFGGRTAAPGVTTLPVPLSRIFVGGAAAAYTRGLTPVQLTSPGLVQGVVHLQGQTDSLGGYVMVGKKIHFLKSDGGFSIPWDGGRADVWIKAPGHLAVIIPQVDVAADTVLTVPELTLPFGDANGDGRIDVLDLTIAAGNFGGATKTKKLP